MAATFRQFMHYNIRDTVTHFPQFDLIEMRGGSQLVFTVQNGHNEAVTVQMIGNDSKGSAGSTVFGNAISVGAGRRSQIAVAMDDVLNSHLGMQVIFATAPTGGDLTVKAKRLD